MARAQYRSLRRLTELPDHVAVWPTHGSGSFCSAPPGAERTSTIGREKATNPLLQAETEDAFVEALLGSLGSFPSYFLRLAEINRRGPAVLHDRPALAPLDIAAVRALLADGATLVDTRPVPEFAAAHIPGAVSIPLRPVFATWLGWLAPPDRPLIIVRGGDQDPVEIAWQAVKIGYDPLAGEVVGGMNAWTADGQATTTTRLVTPAEVDPGRVLDVRQRSEFTAGHLPGATHLELGELTTRAGEVPDEAVVVMCGHGERAMSAASLLEQAGQRDLAVLRASPAEWARATGTALATGS
jgi:rhodanese-related sulfurtransferase